MGWRKQRGGLLAWWLVVFVFLWPTFAGTSAVFPCSCGCRVGGARSQVPIILNRSPATPPPIQIAALLFDGPQPYEPDEGFALWNTTEHPLTLYGWQMSDGTRTLVLPDLTLPPAREVWCAREATAFTRIMGFPPACEYAANTDPDTPDAWGDPLRLPNRGGVLMLRSPLGQVVDAVVYKDAHSASAPWWGEPLRPTPGFREEGQILYRKRRETDARLWPDTDTARDWAQDPHDMREGRRVRYPGWNLDAFFLPAQAFTPTVMTLGVTPDVSDQVLLTWLGEARQEIDIATYTFTSPRVADILARQAERGVRVHILLEGAPAGGLPSEERALAHRLFQAGADVRYLVNDRHTVVERYRYMHAKYAIVDSTWLIVSTENFGLDSFPDPALGPDRMGTRGVILRTNARPLVARARAIFAHDSDPRFSDVFPYDPSDPEYGAALPESPEIPPPGYTWVYTSPMTVTGQMTTTLLTAPENALLTRGGLLGLVDRAGPGDRISVIGLYEHLWWGPAESDPAQSTNPRWRALFDAAARGARVRVLLDGFFAQADGTPINQRVADRVNELAHARGWDLRVCVGNPTGWGVHAKVWLLRVGGERWTLVGSINGSETAHKVNREMAVLVASERVYNLLYTVFASDWQRAGC